MVEPKRQNELLSSNQSRVLVDLNLVNRAKLPYLRPFGPPKAPSLFLYLLVCLRRTKGS